MILAETFLVLGDGVFVRRLGNQLVSHTRRLGQRRDLLEHQQVPAEDELAAPLLVERAGEDMYGGAQEDSAPAASSCFGVSFSGSTNGFSTTIAATVSSGRSISSSVPTSECSVGTMAKPMFFSRRGE